MNITVELPITVHVDNVGVIWLSNKRNTGDRTKHIDERTAFVKEYQEDGKIIIKFVKSDDKSEIEIEPPRENGEQEIGKQDKLLTTTFLIETENRKVAGLITYSADQQIFKFKVNSWGVNIEFTLYELKWTINAILQHMGFIIQQRIHVS